MEIYNKAIALDDSIVEAQENAKMCLETNVRKTTMTIIVTFAYPISVKLQRLSDWLENEGFTVLQNNVYKSVWRMKSGKSFYNCIIVYCSLLKLGTKCSIKIFSNGKLHITGVQSCKEALYFSKKMGVMFNAFTGTNTSHMPADIDIALMNYCLCLPLPVGKQVCLQSVFEDLQKNNVVCIFSNDQHPGIRIKHHISESDKKVTCIVFESGKVLLTCFKNAATLECIITFIKDSLIPIVLQHLHDKSNKNTMKLNCDFQTLASLAKTL
jgi:TATA-box binding protein (TBP) (component of TFIID and TFIIIB)